MNTIKRHLISALVTFLTTIAIAICMAVLSLDKNMALTTYLEAWSVVGFFLVVFRALVKVIFEALVPALKAGIEMLLPVFSTILDWAKNFWAKKE